MQTETILEWTDRILGVAGRDAAPVANVRNADMSSLWNSGLTSSLLFSVNETPLDPTAESEARNIIARHLERAQHDPAPAMSEMVDFQRVLQMRSKVMSAIEMLTCGQSPA